MKVTIEQYDRRIVIDTNSDDKTYEEFIRDFIIPASLALGYQPETIKEYINDE